MAERCCAGAPAPGRGWAPRAALICGLILAVAAWPRPTAAPVGLWLPSAVVVTRSAAASATHSPPVRRRPPVPASMRPMTFSQARRDASAPQSPPALRQLQPDLRPASYGLAALLTALAAAVLGLRQRRRGAEAVGRHFPAEAIWTPYCCSAAMGTVAEAPLQPQTPGFGGRRIRQHVNPLARSHQLPLTLPADWAAAHFPDPAVPVWIDVGCATGEFVLDAARARPDRYVLGLEIRRPAVEKARQLQAALGVPNAHFEACNVNAHFPVFRAALADRGPVERVLVQMPDPWFKRRHQPRRVMTPQFTASIADALMPGGTVFIQSDVLPVAVAMREELDKCPLLRDITDETGGTHAEAGRSWLAANPIGVPSRREAFVLGQGLPVYRAMYRKPLGPGAAQ
eukprot:EG_transcript_12737